MTTKKTVEAADFSGWGLSLAHFVGQTSKFNILCGECGNVWRTRLLLMDWPRAVCPFCDTINIVNIVVS